MEHLRVQLVFRRESSREQAAASSCTGTPGCHFFGLITLVTTPYDLLAKPSMWVLPEWGWCRQLKYQVLSRLEQARVFTVSRSEKETPIGQGEEWQVRWAWRFFFFFSSQHGWIWNWSRSLNHPSSGSSPHPAAPWGRQKMQTLLRFPGRGRSRAGFCLGIQSPWQHRGRGWPSWCFLQCWVRAMMN